MDTRKDKNGNSKRIFLLITSVMLLFVGLAFLGSAGHPSHGPNRIDPGLDPVAIARDEAEWQEYRVRALRHKAEYGMYAKMCIVPALALFTWFVASSVRAGRKSTPFRERTH
jgi:hypothetical protein